MPDGTAGMVLLSPAYLSSLPVLLLTHPPQGVAEAKLQESGFMYNAEKAAWYHQGTEFGRRKAEVEERSIEKLVNYLEVGLPLLPRPPAPSTTLISRNCVEEVARQV